MSSGTEFSESEWKIIRLAQGGMSPMEIRAETGRASGNSVGAVLSRARRCGVPIERFPSGSGVKIPTRMLDILANEAGERKMKTHDLIRTILKNVIDDDLFEAVLGK